MSEVVDILLAAKDKIIDGWVGHCPRADDQTCVLLALGDATTELTGYLRISTLNAASDFIKEAAGLKSTLLDRWNDSQTDKQVVIDAFDAAIRLAKEREL